MENSNKTSYFLKYEISPLLVTKLNQLDGSSYSSIYKAPSFLTEKNNNFIKKNLSNNLPLKLNINDFNKNNNTKEQTYQTNSTYNNKTINSFKYNDIKFESKLFNNNINVFTNFNISQNNNFINKKRNRFISPKDYEKFNLNEIFIQNYHLNNFPLINLTDEQKFINVLLKLTNKKNYFKIKKLEENSDEIFNENLLKKINIPISILKLKNLYYYENEMNVYNILLNYYKDIKNIILNIQKNYINKKRKIYNEKNLLKLEILIRNCNLFTDYIINLYNEKKIPIYQNNEIKILNEENNKKNIFLNNPPSIIKNTKKIPIIFQCDLNKNLNNNFYLNEEESSENNNKTTKKKKKIIFLSKIKKDKFICEFCNKEFKNGQAYGGHLSQTHPNQSKKYKEKIKTRNRRENIRDIIDNCRKSILNKYGYEYNNSSKEKCDKKLVKQILKEHKLEYRKLLINMKKFYGILPDIRKNK
jgi:hypothetical protein